ncbi:FAD-binding oxidoreductase [Flammeovirga sp. SubArs3]|uniref:FAD-binding oxidoreductase n=1 Tax=Flammeovirga sp. SubArs3 TaxID=2995316 RepID=UPI00248C426D|nr:FAD-binding oxidoreductase [Flammeovirga sp. SubArs3]
MKSAFRQTYRQVLRWGNPTVEASLNENTKKVIQDYTGIPALEVTLPTFLPGEKEVKVEKEINLLPSYVKTFTEIVGAENIGTSDFERAQHSAGKNYGELVSLRKGIVHYPPDIIVSPNDHQQLEEIIQKCQEWKLTVIPHGLRSSMSKNIGFNNGGIAIDINKHLNKVVSIDEESLTVTAQAGISGPELENYLNKRGYTCGHFPQSFEFSTLGGWVSSNGVGLGSTGYGTIKDIVLGLKVVTPTGTYSNEIYPKTSQGYDVMSLFIGAEGTLGVISEVTISIRKYEQKHSKSTSIIFKNFEDGCLAMRNCIQGGFGKPHFFRLSDSEETEIDFRINGYNGSFSDRAIKTLGYKTNERCIMHVSVDGDEDYTSFVINKIKSVSAQSGGRNLGNKFAKKWLETRFSSAYMRDPLMDLGLITDILETSVTWKDLGQLWKSVKTYIKAKPNTICMANISHVYENGVNLYFSVITPTDKVSPREDYEHFHKGFIGTILKNKGALSHHYGIGRALAPWLKNKIGDQSYHLMESIKKEIDPNNIMNPGSLFIQ